MSDQLDPIVYIIDDDESVSRAIMRLLISAGLTAQTFRSADEFLSSDFRDQQACLISDVKMPGYTGIELHQKMIEQGRNMPVIFITGYDTPESREQANRIGAVGYFSKPIDDQALLDAINWALSKCNEHERNNDKSIKE